ncbi:MAG: type 1 glutamine amidotransferase [Pseudobdellovibrionaceae bacterium]
MKTLILRHTISTPPGTTIDWLQSKKIPYEVLMVKDIEQWPQVEAFDCLIVCGGGMNVDQEDIYPWLKAEKKFIADAIKAGKKIVGLCLGAQLLAEVLGAKVYRHTHWEVGWHPVHLQAGGELMVFEWHAYTFDLPAGAERTASSAQCRNQAYKVGSQILAYQFHPEANKEWILARAQDSETPKTGFLQTRAVIEKGIDLHLANMQKWFFEQLDQHFKV